MSLMQLVNQFWPGCRAKEDVTALRIVDGNVERSANLSIHAVTRHTGISEVEELVEAIETRIEAGQGASIATADL